MERVLPLTFYPHQRTYPKEGPKRPRRVDLIVSLLVQYNLTDTANSVTFTQSDRLLDVTGRWTTQWDLTCNALPPGYALATSALSKQVPLLAPPVLRDHAVYSTSTRTPISLSSRIHAPHIPGRWNTQRDRTCNARGRTSASGKRTRSLDRRSLFSLSQRRSVGVCHGDTLLPGPVRRKDKH